MYCKYSVGYKQVLQGIVSIQFLQSKLGCCPNSGKMTQYTFDFTIKESNFNSKKIYNL